MDFQLYFGKRGRAEADVVSAFGYAGVCLEFFPGPGGTVGRSNGRAYFVEWNPPATTRVTVQRTNPLAVTARRYFRGCMGYGLALTPGGRVAFRYCWIQLPHWLFPLPFLIPLFRWAIRRWRGERRPVRGECVMCGCYLHEGPGFCPGCRDRFLGVVGTRWQRN